MSSATPIFLFAPGQRCGSTMIQRLLNSLPKTFIWGEHDGFLRTVRQGTDRLAHWDDTFDDQKQVYLSQGYNSWIPCLVPEASRQQWAVKAYINALFGQSPEGVRTQRWGFKEVRYDAQIAQWLVELFPQAKLLFINRHIKDCFISLLKWEKDQNNQWTRKRTLDSLNNWVAINRSFLSFGKTFPNLYSFRYEDVVSDKLAFVTQLTKFLELDPSDTDASVLDCRLFEPNSAVDARPAVSISEEDYQLIRNDAVKYVLEASGYSL